MKNLNEFKVAIKEPIIKKLNFRDINNRKNKFSNLYDFFQKNFYLLLNNTIHSYRYNDFWTQSNVFIKTRFEHDSVETMDITIMSYSSTELEKVELLIVNILK